MSKIVDQLFESLKQVVPEITAEAGRMTTQGAAELANALFNGTGYVPYGPGQQPVRQEEQASQEQENQIER